MAEPRSAEAGELSAEAARIGRRFRRVGGERLAEVPRKVRLGHVGQEQLSCCAGVRIGPLPRCNCERIFALALCRSQNKNSVLVDHRELHATLLNVQDVLTRGALGKDDFGSPIVHDLSGNARRVEKGLSVEWALGFRFHADFPCNAPVSSLSKRAT